MAKAIVWAHVGGQRGPITSFAIVSALADALPVNAFAMPTALALATMCHLAVIPGEARLTEAASKGLGGLEGQHAVAADPVARAALTAVLLPLFLLQLFC